MNAEQKKNRIRCALIRYLKYLEIYRPEETAIISEYKELIKEYN